MLKRFVPKVVLLLGLMFSQESFSQINLLNAKTPATIGVKNEAQKEADNDKPLPYAYVDDRDIMWSTTVWERIDLKQRVNFPLLFPIDSTNVSRDRRSLFDVLLKAMKTGELTETYTDSYFAEKRTYKDLEGALVKIDTLEAGYEILNSGGGDISAYITKKELSAADITAYEIKGLWYFDKRQGELKYRLLGIAPVATDITQEVADGEEAQSFALFWVWYPAVREILHNAKVFNIKNSAKPISFDHLLNSRRFSAVIYKQDNVYEDRKIESYLPGNSLYQLLESDRIKERIRDREQDMWAH